jgi:hypothetical protein
MVSDMQFTNKIKQCDVEQWNQRCNLGYWQCVPKLPETNFRPSKKTNSHQLLEEIEISVLEDTIKIS